MRLSFFLPVRLLLSGVSGILWVFYGVAFVFFAYLGCVGCLVFGLVFAGYGSFDDELLLFLVMRFPEYLVFRRKGILGIVIFKSRNHERKTMHCIQ